MLYNDTRELIGNTPLIKINNYVKYKKYNFNLYVKLEKQNITNSCKDRAALFIIENLLKRQIVKENDYLIVPTSGNLGISLGYICKKNKLRLIVVLPENSTIERIKILKLLNVKIIKSKKEEGINGSIDVAKKISEKYQIYYLDQFNTIFNVYANYFLGKEINNELKRNIDYIICGIGSGGTISGITQYFNKENKSVKIIGVIPKDRNHQIFGLNTDLEVGNLKHINVHKIMNVTFDEVKNNQKEFMEIEGLLIGRSSAAVLSALEQVKSELLKNSNVVLIFPDGLERYLSV